METTTLKGKALHRFKALLACAVSFALVAAMVPLAGLNVQSAWADDGVVSTFDELKSAIEKGGTQTITINSDISMTGTINLPLDSNITLKGSTTLSSDDAAVKKAQLWSFFKASGSGVLNIDGLKITGQTPTEDAADGAKTYYIVNGATDFQLNIYGDTNIETQGYIFYNSAGRSKKTISKSFCIYGGTLKGYLGFSALEEFVIEPTSTVNIEGVFEHDVTIKKNTSSIIESINGTGIFSGLSVDDISDTGKAVEISNYADTSMLSVRLKSTEETGEPEGKAELSIENTTQVLKLTTGTGEQTKAYSSEQTVTYKGDYALSASLSEGGDAIASYTLDENNNLTITPKSAGATTLTLSADDANPVEIQIYVVGITFNGGSLRMDYTDASTGKTIYDKTSMRFGYSIELPEALQDKADIYWKYGMSVNSMYFKRSAENKDTNGNTITTNIVFTDIPALSYKENIYAELHVDVALDEQTYSLTDEVRTRTVSYIATCLVDNVSQDIPSDQVAYATEILKQCKTDTAEKWTYAQ